MVQLQIIGNLTRDAEVKQIGTNAYTTFTAAVNIGKEQTIFVNVNKRNAENGTGLSQYLTKGKKVFVQGQLSVSAYIGRDGNAYPDTTLWADKIELLGGGDNREGAQA